MLRSLNRASRLGYEMISAVEKNSGGTIEFSATYKYDAFGNQTESDETPYSGGSPGSTTTTQYVLDGWDPHLAGTIGNSKWNVLAEKTNGSLTTRNMWGDVTAQLFAELTYSGTFTPRWIFTDMRNSVRDVLDNSGSVIDSIDYSAFGVKTESSPGDLGRYGWDSYDYSAKLDLYKANARWYDTQSGRWLSQDPLGFDAGDSNLYRYVNNRPTVETDPSGLDDVPRAVPTVPNDYYSQGGSGTHLPDDYYSQGGSGSHRQAVPQLDIDQNIIKGPLSGTHGSYIWPVRFRLTTPTSTGGWIIQKIKTVYTALDENEKDISKTVFKNVDNAEYWEAWEIPPMAKDHAQIMTDGRREFFAGFVTTQSARLASLGKYDNPNRKRNDDERKRIENGDWDKFTDVFLLDLNAPGNPGVLQCAKGTVTITAEAFFVNNPTLYTGMTTADDAKATQWNKNKNAGALPNLTVNQSAQSLGMLTWLTENASLTSNIIKRSVVVTWGNKGDSIVTNVAVDPPP